MNLDTSRSIVRVWIQRAVLLIGLLQFSSGRASEEEQVLVFTDARQGLQAPTRERPIYYLAMPAKGGAFTKIGPFLPQKADEKLTADQVWPLIEKALDRQGFRNVLRVKPRSAAPKPELLIVFQWGGVKRDFGMLEKTTNDRILQDILDALEDIGSDAAHEFYNADQVGELLGVQVTDRNSPDFTMVQAASQADRYYITLTAYDFESANTGKPKKKLIWRARMSTEAGAEGIAAVLQSMISVGAPFFGKNSVSPKQITWDRTKVEVGELTVVPSATTPNK
jgi:hypothetical protein